MCQQLLYIEVDDYVANNAGWAKDDAVAATDPEEKPAAHEPPNANAFVVSLHALAGIWTENTMLLLVMVKGKRLPALLDTGSTHNFLRGATMHRLGLSLGGGSSSGSPSPTATAYVARGSPVMSPSASGARTSSSLVWASTSAVLTSSSASTT
jgi:hypothetical protein